MQAGSLEVLFGMRINVHLERTLRQVHQYHRSEQWFLYKMNPENENTRNRFDTIPFLICSLIRKASSKYRLASSVAPFCIKILPIAQFPLALDVSVQASSE
jgi:hypothetical protein